MENMLQNYNMLAKKNSVMSVVCWHVIQKNIYDCVSICYNYITCQLKFFFVAGDIVMSNKSDDDAIFKALADKKRRKILDLLKEKPMCTGDICSCFANLNRCTIMQHLAVLETAGLIIVQRKGRFRWNYLNPLPIKQIYDRWINKYSSGAIDFLNDVKKEMEDG